MHRPERWGYVQFSTAKPGSAAFRPDPERHVRDQLHRVYYAQREHRAKTGTYADSLEALEAGCGAASRRTLRIERTRSSFEAELPDAWRNAASRWVISQDSWIRKVDPEKKKKS